MDSLNPKVSIYIPWVKGYEIYLEKAIKSIFDQTYLNLDLKVIIEGSNKKAKTICESFKEKEDFTFTINEKPIGLQKIGNLFAEEALS